MMNLFIDNHSGIPIYDQICSQLRTQIMDGSIKEDAMLPSIRSLAKDLRISVITTKRAYEELEREGLLYTVPGKGCFVSTRGPELMREENLKRIEAHLEEAVRLSAAAGISRKELREILDVCWEETV